MRRTLAAVLAVAGLTAACTGGSDSGTSAVDGSDRGDCIGVDMAVSSEKISLLTELAKEFNDSDAEIDGTCIDVAVRSKSSGGAAALLADGWPEPEINGPQPVIWSPAASGWGGVLNQRLATKGEPAMAPEGTPFMLTPLVIAMPEPMAEALGYPDTPVGFADIARLAADPDGWAAFGHPEWGPFRLGKTNPNFSTSGLNFTIAQYYAATGKAAGLTTEDLRRADVQAFSEQVEASVVHYGDITMTFLNNWFRADARGTALTYASAVAVEEKSVIDYNLGNPDGVLSPGEQPRVPRIPLVAIYPSEGTLFSDNPFYVLDAPWVSEQQKAAAAQFAAYVQTPENQTKVLEFGFRPGNPAVAVAAPIEAANGVDPDQPQTLLEVPEPPVLTGILDAWADQRKRARVLIVLDISGSMGDLAADTGQTKLDLARQAAIEALDEFADDDQVGLRVFSTDLGPQGQDLYLDLVPVGPMSEVRDDLRNAIDRQFPTNGTPLYDTAAASYVEMLDFYDPELINAVVFLTDGVNDDGDPDDDEDQLQGLLDELQVGSEGSTSRPVRIFPIAYGADADLAVLKRIAEATNAAAYDASNPATISQVFTAVVSNF